MQHEDVFIATNDDVDFAGGILQSQLFLNLDAGSYLVALAGWDTLRAVAAIDPHRAVDCCAAVYELAVGAPVSTPASDSLLMAGFAASSAVLLLAVVAGRRRRVGQRDSLWIG